MVGPFARYDFIFGRTAPPRQRPFLQRRLRMLRRRRLSLDHITPMGENEAARRVDALVEIERAAQRLDRVGGDIRSEERGVGNEWVRKCRVRGSPYHLKKQTEQQ